MKLTILVENNTFIDHYLTGEPALSYYIEDDGKKILFDCGYSNIFIENAFKLGIDLRVLDYVVLSHSHQDHTWGLNNLISLYNDSLLLGRSFEIPTLIAHPEIFRSTKIEGIGEIGSVLSETKLSNTVKINLKKEPYFLTENLVYLGDIPRENDFENLSPIGFNQSTGKPDFMPDDTALVYKTNEGLVIITACSHAGICNICEYAKNVCNEDRITDIIGGLHLLTPDMLQMNKTLEYIKSLSLNNLYACHCTDLDSKIKLSQVSHIKETGTGLVLKY